MTDRLLTAAELGEMLSFAAGTIVDRAERGTIPAFKLGGRLRFREGEVLDWLEDQPHPCRAARTRRAPQARSLSGGEFRPPHCW